MALPKTSAEKLSPQQLPMVVSIDAAGKYYLNTATTPGSPLNADDLVNSIQAAIRHDPQQQRPILIKGDKDVDYGKVVQVFVLLQQAGVNNVGLVTEPLSKV